jgi:ABC-2 type transport system permease protein
MTTITRQRTHAAPGSLDHLTGVGRLLWFMLRRDRIRLPGWVFGLTLMMAYFTTALKSLLATPEDVAGMAGFASTPVGALFGGPALGYDNLTIERFLASQYGLYILLGAALMGLLTVTRHTRAEERSGRAELVRANVVGRHAQLTAALVLAALMSALVAVLIAGVMAGAGFDTTGSVVFGAGVGAGGLVFAGIAAITVQLSEYPRAAAGMAGTALGAAFVLRGLGDMAAVQGSGPAWLSWLSPLGWSQQTGPYVFDRWWPLVLSLLFAGVTAAAGYILAGRRDHGAGLVPPRPGSPVAASWLRSPRTLAFRLHRGSLIGWSVALLVAGLAYGAFTQPMLDGFADAPEDLIAVMGGGEDMLNGFLGLMGLMMAFTVSVFVVLAMQSVRGEETDGRAEPVLATAVSRPDWLGGHVAVIGLGVVWLLLVAGTGMGVGAAMSTGDGGLIGDLIVGHVAHTPAVWLVLAVAALVYGAVPRALPAVWLIVGYGMVVGFFAPILDLPVAAVNLSPFEHVGEYPLEDIGVGAMLLLATGTGLVAAAALGTFRRRDLVTT